MNYEEFKKEVIEKFLSYMPQEYRDMELVVNKVNKVNRTLDGINLIGGKNHRNVSPTIYINEMYEYYQQCEDLQNVLQKAAELMERFFDSNVEIPQINFRDAKENIVFQLLNTEQNKALLAEVPHREFLDLSIIYRWIVKMDAEEIQSSLVTNNLAQHLGLTEGQLFRLATENTRRIFQPYVKNMGEVLFGMTGEFDGVQQEMVETMSQKMPADNLLYLISNDMFTNGAIVMLYEDELQTLANHLESDLYIIPSSVDEVLAVSAESGDLDKLEEMISEVNMFCVALEKRLSNKVYYYDRNLRKLSFATNDFSKRIDE